MKNGDLVYCQNGHVMCEVVDASMRFMPNMWGDAFGKWRGRTAPPEKGGPMPVCLDCGAAMILPDAVQHERDRRRRGLD